MLTLSNREKSDKLGKLMTSSRGESDRVPGLFLADAFAVNSNL